MTELVYALVQAGHNLGAVLVVASPAVALGLQGRVPGLDRRLAWTLLAAWALLAASGAGFAAASLGLKGQLPEVAGVALAALVVKMTATAGGLALSAGLLRLRPFQGARPRTAVWAVCLGLALAALLAAAPLRWYL